jgi:hypothetical protein
MDIELSHEELRDLFQALDHQLRALRQELVHTDDRSMRHELREDLDRVERLRARLDQRAGLDPAG